MPTPERLYCPICNRGLQEMPSWQRGWRYFKHPGRQREEIVIVSPDMLELFETFEEALTTACDALHFEEG